MASFSSVSRMGWSFIALRSLLWTCVTVCLNWFLWISRSLWELRVTCWMLASSVSLRSLLDFTLSWTKCSRWLNYLFLVRLSLPELLMPKVHALFVRPMHLPKAIEVELPHKRFHALMPKETGQHFFYKGLSVLDLNVICWPADNIAVAAFLHRLIRTSRIVCSLATNPATWERDMGYNYIRRGPRRLKNSTGWQPPAFSGEIGQCACW